MMGRMQQWTQRAFTLIELVIVIAIIGILAAIAIPRLVDLRVQADTAAEEGVVGAVRSGILLRTAENIANKLGTARPADLEGEALATGTCDANTNGCFDDVLDQGVTDTKWKVQTVAPQVYRHTRIDATTKDYTYDSTKGTFQ